ncbi:hypothetical protein L3X38_005315 [Prunus dulcis]|uniref:Uncharacterized protein n=1 Tax=Prunus dulcis TaxID=3755 RepID=A0AAD4ZQS1_PRUDU|nr:hypothetical protein L3X38_005315 [Prunus dulcis]
MKKGIVDDKLMEGPMTGDDKSGLVVGRLGTGSADGDNGMESCASSPAVGADGDEGMGPEVGSKVGAGSMMEGGEIRLVRDDLGGVAAG